MRTLLRNVQTPSATWYDRSIQAQTPIGKEIQLAKSGHLRPSDRPRALRAERQLRNPLPTDVTVSFETRGKQEKVTVVGGRHRRILFFNLDPSVLRSFKRLETYVRRVVAAVAQVL
jgi:hypothetical protein